MTDKDKPCPYHEMKAVGKSLLGENDPEALWKPAIIKHQREQEKRR
jgi:hypothetical protein